MESKIAGSFSNWLKNRRSKPSHRQLLVLSGNSKWTQQTAELAIQKSKFENILWVGDRDDRNSVEINRYKRYLGQEFTAIVYNAHSGVRANALIALSGSVTSQGLMILLCPDFSKWPSLHDPEVKNKESYGYSAKPIHSYFIQWLVTKLQEDDFVTIVTQDKYYPARKQAWAENTSITLDQQKAAITAIVNTACGRNNRPLVITADRGRGKTSALGIATESLFQQGFNKVLITAPNFDTVALAFKHAHSLIEDSKIDNQSLLYKEARLDFCAPDELLEKDPNGEIVFVDEAAAIPTDMLKSICKKFPKVIFSTTIHGYEGSGRGFEIRFKQFLTIHFPNWKNLHLDHPIRWFRDDVLERFWFNALLMQIEQADRNSLVCVRSPTHYRKIEKSELVNSPALLAEIFQLLINAHYQTSPDDLNRLLDARDQHIYAAFNHSRIVSVVLASNEGGEQIADLAADISNGKRRVQGHLVAQSILYLTGSCDYAHLRYLRIVRIAVPKSQQRQGYATGLLNYVKESAKHEGIDLLCVSYGLNLSILHFWLKNHFRPVKIGTKRDASSGEHSMIMLLPITERSSFQLQELSKQFHQELIYQASRHFSKLSPKLISHLLTLDKSHKLSKQQFEKLRQLQERTRHWQSCESTLRQLVLSTTILPTDEALESHALLSTIFIQNRDHDTIQKARKMTGKKQFSKAIVEATYRLLSLR
jgi:tRNA(Met) cytidine acetyltransferase